MNGNLANGFMQGLTAGMDFQDQRQATAERSRRDDELLRMRRDQHEWQTQQRAQEEAAQQQRAAYQDLYRQTASELGQFADPEAVGAEVLKRGLKSGVIPSSEIQPLMEQAANLRKLGLSARIRAGDVAGIQDAFSKAYGKPVALSVEDGKDEYGQPARFYHLADGDGKTVGRLSQLQMGMLLGADDLLAEEEQRRKAQEHKWKGDEARSRIRENDAQASAARALAQQRRENPTGAKPYVPASAKNALYWRTAPESEVAAEVERQLAKMRSQAASDPFATTQLEKPEVLDELRNSIRIGLTGQQVDDNAASRMLHPLGVGENEPVETPGASPAFEKYFR